MTSSVAAPGLCASCRFARRIGNRRGSTFIRCGRAAAEPRYPRYPPLPVLHCPGYDAAVGSDPDPAEP
jgi:hypothetical protein